MDIGKIVISKSGRDKGEWFVIVKIEDSYIYIADGKIRKLENPKRKNPKHLQKTNKFLVLDESISNKRLNKLILELKHSN